MFLTHTTISTPFYLRASWRIMNFLFKYEDFYEKPTLDSGVIKIGFGHIVDKFYTMPAMNMWQGIGLWRSDIEEIEDYLNNWFPHILDYQFDGLLSLIIDIGLDAFDKTDIPRELDKRRSNVIPRLMMEAPMDPDKEVRRKKEVNIFIGESYTRPVFGGKNGEFCKAMKKSYII